MKLIVFSDIHGNYIALEKMIKKTLQMNVTYYIHLGDIFGYFYEQKKIINIFKAMNIMNIKGNHDEYFIEITRDQSNIEVYKKKYGLSFTKNLELLNSEEKKYIFDLKEKLEISYKKYKILFCHGSPFDYLNGRIYPDNKDFNLFNQLDYNLFFLGHTHYRLKKKINNKLIINPGSLGLPRDGNGFSYIYCDLDNGIFRFDNIEMSSKEIEEIIDKHEDSNLYESINRVINRGEK